MMQKGTRKPGRPRIPTALKRARGRARSDREPAHEAEPTIEIPEMPDFLKGEAAKEWKRIVVDLYNLGLLTRLDRSALTGYCEAFGLWYQCQDGIAEKGLFITNPAGHEILNPLLGVSRKAVDQMKAFAVEFGMPPASRTRIEAKPPEKKTAPKGKPAKGQGKKVVGFFE